MSIAHKLAIASFLVTSTLASAQASYASRPNSIVTGSTDYTPDYTTRATFRDKLARCSDAVLAHRQDAATAATCAEAAGLEGRVQGTLTERLQANSLAAISSANAGSLRQALTFADKAVHLADHAYLEVHKGEPIIESAHNMRASIRLQAGDIAGADQDAAQAETAARNMKAVGLGSDRLRADLQSHAAILDRLSQPGEAQVKLNEAQKLWLRMMGIKGEPLRFAFVVLASRHSLPD